MKLRIPKLREDDPARPMSGEERDRTLCLACRAAWMTRRLTPTGLCPRSGMNRCRCRNPRGGCFAASQRSAASALPQDEVPDRPDAATLARRLADALDAEDLSCAIGGALALGHYTPPRATVDVDLNVFIAVPEEIVACLRTCGFEPDDRSAVERTAVEDGQFRGRIQGMRLAVFVPAIDLYASLERGRRRVSFAGRPVRKPILQGIPSRTRIVIGVRENAHRHAARRLDFGTNGSEQIVDADNWVLRRPCATTALPGYERHRCQTTCLHAPGPRGWAIEKHAIRCRLGIRGRPGVANRALRKALPHLDRAPSDTPEQGAFGPIGERPDLLSSDSEYSTAPNVGEGRHRSYLVRQRLRERPDSPILVRSTAARCEAQ